MEHSKTPELFVAGLDSGVISAYVILNLNGEIIEFNSFRNSSPDILVKELTKKGRIVLLGSDVKPASSLTKKISQRIGARVLEPEHNPGFLEKIRVVDSFLKSQNARIPLRNRHEKDALASAIYGLKQINTLLAKIDNHLRQLKKEQIKKAVLYKVLIENKPISVAVREC